jgi:chromosomal replication initiator protein DnaA
MENALDVRERNILNPNYLFENFVTGKSIHFARSAAIAVSESPGEAFNPLFICGGAGLGKTHLLHAIAHRAETKLRGARILYVHSEEFTNELISAIKNNSYGAFKAKYRNLDILLIDDIQFIIGKERTQEEFFNTFNSLYEASKQIVISSDRPPRDLRQNIEERLISRFESGVIADIQAPDLETRAAILKKKALLKKIEIPEESLLLIAQNVSDSPRKLEAASNYIAACSEIYSLPATHENICLWLKDGTVKYSENNLLAAAIKIVVDIFRNGCVSNAKLGDIEKIISSAQKAFAVTVEGPSEPAKESINRMLRRIRQDALENEFIRKAFSGKSCDETKLSVIINLRGKIKFDTNVIENAVEAIGKFMGEDKNLFWGCSFDAAFDETIQITGIILW